MAAMSTPPALVDIVIGDEKCQLVYEDGVSFYVSRETYNRALGTLVQASAMGQRDDLRKDYEVAA